MLKSLLRLSARNALRNRVRTGLTAGMVVLGVALLILGISWMDGIFGQMFELGTDMAGHVRVVNPAYAEDETLLPLYENIEDTAPMVRALAAHPKVKAVYPRITTGVTVTAGEEIGEYFALAVGAPEAYFRERMKGDQYLTAGKWLSGKSDDELILGRTVAKQIGAGVGDEVILLGLTQHGSMSPIKGTLVGITSGDNPLYNRAVWVPLAKMRWLADIEEGATEVLVYGRQFKKSERLAASLASVAELEGQLVQPWQQLEPWASTLKQIGGIQGFIAFLIIFLTALGIWNTMMMSVLERTHEIGVLRAMGLTRIGTVGLFVVEALAIAVIGGGLGVALGAIPSWLLETYGIHLGDKIVSQMAEVAPISATVYGDLTVRGMVLGFSMGLVMAIAGSVIPAQRAASIQPVTAMRSGR